MIMKHGGIPVLLSLLLLMAATPLYAQGQPYPIRIRLDYIIGGKHAPFFVALEKGFYAEEGLKVEELARGLGSADTVKVVAQGLADFGFADTGTTIVGRTRGLAVRAIGVIYGRTPFTVVRYKDAGIDGPRDLIGKSVGAEPGTSLYQMFPVLLRANDIPQDAVRLVSMKAEAKTPALLQGRIDAMLGYFASEDVVAVLQARRMGRELAINSWSDWGVDVYGNGLITTDRMIEEQPEVVEGFVRATFRGFKWAREHPDEAVDILLKHQPQLEREAVRIQLEQILEVAFTPEAAEHGLGYMDPAKMASTIEIVKNFYQPEGEIVPEQVYTNQFVEAARVLP